MTFEDLNKIQSCGLRPTLSISKHFQAIVFFSILFLDVSLLRQWQRYGIRKNGQHVARLRVSGAGANDWEDIAIGPGDCPQDVHDSADSAVDNGGQA